MATITASSVGTGDSLETFRQQFNALRSDISGLTFTTSLMFEGATTNDFETTLAVVDPTADRTITLPDATDTVAVLSDLGDKLLLNGTDSSSSNAGDEVLMDASATGTDEGEQILLEDGTGDHLLNTPSVDLGDILLESSNFAKSNFLLDEVDSVKIEFETATEDALLGGLFVPPASGGVQMTMPSADGVEDQVLATDGSGTLSFKNQASGMSLSNDANNRVVTATGAGSGNAEANLIFDGSTLTVTGNITVPNDGDIGSVGATDAIQISSGGIVTLKDDLLLKDAATIGNASVADVMTLASTGIVTFKDDILIKDGGTIGVTSAATAITIASTGIVTFVDDIIIKDAGTIGSATVPGAIAISSAGVVALAATTAASATGTAALTVAGGIGVAGDMWIGDDIVMDSDSAVIQFGDDQEIALTHNHNVGLKMTSTAYAPLSRRGEDVFIVLDGTNSASANAGDNVIMDRSAAGTDVGDDIIGEDEVFLHSGMQRNVLEIRDSGGSLLNSVAGFAPGAI